MLFTKPLSREAFKSLAIIVTGITEPIFADELGIITEDITGDELSSLSVFEVEVTFELPEDVKTSTEAESDEASIEVPLASVTM